MGVNDRSLYENISEMSMKKIGDEESILNLQRMECEKSGMED